MNAWQFYTEQLIRFGLLGHRLYILRRDSLNGDYALVTSMTMEHLESGQFVPQDKASLDDSRMPGPTVREFLQAASDAAWELGIKPKQLESSMNELAAVRYHLEDMRKIALKP